MGEVATLITTLGFPIVACVGMAWYVKYITDQHEKSRKEESDKHKEEVASMTQALNNNTLAITTLTERLQLKERED